MTLSHIHGSQPSSRPVGQAAGLRVTDHRQHRFAGARQTGYRDVVRFGGAGIRVEGGTAADVDRHLPSLEKARHHARKARHHMPNLSGRHYGSLVVLDDGETGLGTNLEATRQITLCDLRLAVSTAMNHSIAAKGDCPPCEDKPHAPTVKTIYLVNADPDGEPPVPCADCQEWLNSDFCTPDTQVVSLERANGGDFIRIRTVADMLPLHKGREPVRMTTAKPLDELLETPAWSESALTVLENLSPAQRESLTRRLDRMVRKAQTAYLRNESAGDSRKRTGVSVLVSPLNVVLSGGRFDWTTRWFEGADLKTAASAFQLTQFLQGLIHRLPEWLRKPVETLLQGPKIQAVAYYGDDSEMPPIPSLGRIGRRRGSSETLILTVENDRLQIRTVADFMPDMYQTRPRA